MNSQIAIIVAKTKHEHTWRMLLDIYKNSGVSEGAGVEFPTFPLTCVVVLNTLWHYRASV